MTKVFIIKYDVHCKLQNFFGKETKVKNCMSEMHAKVKLNDYVKQKYGIEFTHIIIISCKEDGIAGLYNDLFGGCGDKSMNDLFKNFKSKMGK